MQLPNTTVYYVVRIARVALCVCVTVAVGILQSN